MHESTSWNGLHFAAMHVSWEVECLCDRKLRPRFFFRAGHQHWYINTLHESYNTISIILQLSSQCYSFLFDNLLCFGDLCHVITCENQGIIFWPNMYSKLSTRLSQYCHLFCDGCHENVGPYLTVSDIAENKGRPHVVCQSSTANTNEIIRVSVLRKVTDQHKQ